MSLTTIKTITPGSPAHQAGVRLGETLTAINGHRIVDVLDYKYYSYDPELELTLKEGETERTVALTKEIGEDLGLEFETYLMDRARSCANNCIFCFVDQMPCGMRDTLYFKDDDERLSFLYGNYITLTNLSQKDADRIAAMRISPINISVHTVDPEMRVKMMINRFAGETLRYIDQFAAAGIEMNFQIVLCPGWNDGAYLQQSLEKLSSYYPAARSIAVVPIGLTKYREGLPHIDPLTGESAAATIDQIEAVGRANLEKYGERLVYPSDEFFLLAKRPIPDAEYYGDYSQLENGVGMMRLLEEEFDAALAKSRRKWLPFKADLVTGEASYGLLCTLAEKCMKKNPGLRLQVHCIKNEFFGGNVTVTGLVTGRDLLAQLEGKLISRRLLLPRVMLRAEKDLFLDDVHVDDVAKKLNVGVRVTESDGADLLDAMLGR